MHVLGRLQQNLAYAEVHEVCDNGRVRDGQEEVERALLELEEGADPDEGEHVHDDVQRVHVEVRRGEQPEVLLVYF